MGEHGSLNKHPVYFSNFNNRLYVAKKKSPEADAGWDSQSQTHGKPPCRGLVEIDPCVLSSFGNMKIADQPLHFVS